MGVCIDRFRLEIGDQDIRNFVPAFPFAETSVRQVLSHATDGRFRYDPALYSSLTPVVESKECFNQNFRQAMATEILERLALTALGAGSRSCAGQTARRRARCSMTPG